MRSNPLQAPAEHGAYLSFSLSSALLLSALLCPICSISRKKERKKEREKERKKNKERKKERKKEKKKRTPELLWQCLVEKSEHMLAKCNNNREVIC